MPYTIVLLSISVSVLSYGQGPKIGACPVLPADNIWNTPIDTLPVSPNSGTYVNTIGPVSPVHADFGSGNYNGGPIGIPYVKVAGTQTKYSATFLYWDESDPGPYAVPLTAPIEGGSNSTGDRHAIAVDTENCKLYELYRAFPQTSSWNADSGAIYDLNSNALRTSGWTSADAAGLPILPGLVRYDEIALGEIRHAIRFTVPQTQRAFVWPARHYASSLTDTKYPPMGQRFRLKASFDVSPFPADVQMILRALKKYGMILADNGSAWFLSGEPDSRWNNSNLSTMRNITGSDFEAVDVSSLMIDPNSGQAKQTGASVVVTPSAATVTTQATKQFTANTAVNWSVNSIAGGNSQIGYIDTNGLYSAPSSVPSPETVQVIATSKITPTLKGSASVTIVAPQPVSISISPTSATVRVRRTVQLTATVQNTTNKGVTWKVNGITGGNATVGTVSTGGLYTAPGTVPASPVQVSATSIADPTKTATATVQIRRR
jgi:hypothetical protein